MKTKLFKVDVAASSAPNIWNETVYVVAPSTDAAFDILRKNGYQIQLVLDIVIVKSVSKILTHG